MVETMMYWAGEIVRQVPIVTWVGVLLTALMLGLWFTKHWAPTRVLALVCALYAVTPYLPAPSNFLPH